MQRNPSNFGSQALWGSRTRSTLLASEQQVGEHDAAVSTVARGLGVAW
jgi:hypothetical protein